MNGPAGQAQQLPAAPVTAGQDAPGCVTAAAGPEAARGPCALVRHFAGDLAAGRR
jgi:hypothetical protein